MLALPSWTQTECVFVVFTHCIAGVVDIARWEYAMQVDVRADALSASTSAAPDVLARSKSS